MTNNNSSNGQTRQSAAGAELFQNLRRVFEKAQIRYPSFSDEFLRATHEHISKVNHSTTTDENNSQIISGVVKLRI